MLPLCPVTVSNCHLSTSHRQRLCQRFPQLRFCPSHRVDAMFLPSVPSRLRVSDTNTRIIHTLVGYSRSSSSSSSSSPPAVFPPLCECLCSVLSLLLLLPFVDVSVCERVSVRQPACCPWRRTSTGVVNQASYSKTSKTVLLFLKN